MSFRVEGMPDDEAVARQSGEIHWLQILQSALKENRYELYWQPIVSAYGANGPATTTLSTLLVGLPIALPPP